MAEKAPSPSSPVAPKSTILITELNSNDVLLGRGSGPSQFVGNRRFRALVDEHKEDYNAAHRNKEKKKIAKDIFDRICSLGGRFLKPAENETSADDAEEEKEETWYEVNTPIALEKCKQALRENRERQGSSDGINEGFNVLAGETALQGRNTVSSSGVGVGIFLNPATSGGFVHGQSPSLPPNFTPVLPSIVVGRMGPFVGDIHPFLFQSALSAFQQQATAAQPTAANPVLPPQFTGGTQTQNFVTVLPNTYHPATQGLLQDLYRTINYGAAAAYGSYLANNVLPSRLRDRMPPETGSVATVPVPTSSSEITSGAMKDSQSNDSGCTTAFSSPSTSERGASDAVVSEDEASDFLMFCVQASGRPMFTEEQERIEQATMTDEEKAEALSDLFGRSCAISTHKHKKARLDLDEKSIAFLVQQMRLELERIPEDQKQALVEAESKCRAEEFSDARLERFLRCEGMNVKVRILCMPRTSSVMRNRNTSFALTV
jgi:hypothetical protein